MEIGDKFIYMVRETHFISAGLVVSNVGGVKCQPFLKCSNHWKATLKRQLCALVTF